MLVVASLTDPIVQFAVDVVDKLGLPGIFVLMVAESACIPIPSEATFLFAGFNVSEGHYSLAAVVAVGTAANLVGSWIAYAVGYYGRIDILEKHGAKLHIKPSHLQWADRWFERYGSATVFFTRMLPIIRTFISLPAGVARMPFWRFTILTTLGCIPWIFMLTFIGMQVGENWESWKDDLHYVDYAVVAMIVLGVALPDRAAAGAGAAVPRPAEPRLRDSVALGLLQGPAELLPISSSAHVELLGRRLAGYARLSAARAQGAGGGAARGQRARAGRGVAAARERARRCSPPRRRRPRWRGCVARGPDRAPAVGAAARWRRAASPGRSRSWPPTGARRRAPPATRGLADALWLGLAQAAALAPGVSRSGATRAAARARGFTRAGGGGARRARPRCRCSAGATALKGVRLARRRPAGARRWRALGAGAAAARRLDARALRAAARAGAAPPRAVWAAYRVGARRPPCLRRAVRHNGRR